MLYMHWYARVDLAEVNVFKKYVFLLFRVVFFLVKIINKLTSVVFK